jgi:predicted RNase H-like HicB family nuclease
MRFYSFQIVLEKEPDDSGYFAHSPSLPGCFSNGATMEEARRNMREAIQQHVSSLLSRGEPVPADDRFVHVEEVSVGIPA